MIHLNEIIKTDLNLYDILYLDDVSTTRDNIKQKMEQNKQNINIDKTVKQTDVIFNLNIIDTFIKKNQQV